MNIAQSELAQWAATRETSEEIAAAILARSESLAEADAIWAEPTPEALAGIIAEARKAQAEPAALYWGEEVYPGILARDGAGNLIYNSGGYAVECAASGDDYERREHITENEALAGARGTFRADDGGVWYPTETQTGTQWAEVSA